MIGGFWRLRVDGHVSGAGAVAFPTDSFLR
jgi:hypothetical protein